MEPGGAIASPKIVWISPCLLPSSGAHDDRARCRVGPAATGHRRAVREVGRDEVLEPRLTIRVELHRDHVEAPNGDGGRALLGDGLP